MGNDSILYLDNAATSWPKPKRVLDAMTRFHLEEAGSPNRSGHQLAAAAERVVQISREMIARLIGAPEPDRVIHCFNCTDALNMAIKGAVREGDHVITTDMDHNSVLRPIQAMVDRGYVTATRLPLSEAGYVDPDAFARAITPKTRLIATLHASNVTGALQPIDEIGRIAAEHGCTFLVDAAQSIGLVDIDVEAMHIDLLAFPGHKSLLGPTGTGGLYVAGGTTMTPWREGGTGWDSLNPVQPAEYPTFLEAGTVNTVGLAGLNAAMEGLSPAETLARERELMEHAAAALVDHPRIRLVGPVAPARSVGVMSLLIDGLAPAEVGRRLDRDFRIAVRPGLHCAPYLHRHMCTTPDGTVRLSVGGTTTRDDMDRLVHALTTIASTV